MSEGYEGAAHSEGYHTRVAVERRTLPDSRCCVPLLLSLRPRMSRQRLVPALFVGYSERRNGANAGMYCACGNGCDRSVSQKMRKHL
jgi:hypothetical protein